MGHLERTNSVNSANPQRSLPSRKLIKRELEAGKLGEPGLIRVHCWEGSKASDPAGEFPPALLEQLDLILWLMGKPPQRVYASDLRRVSGRPGTYVQIHLSFPGNAMGLLVYARLLPESAPYCSLHVIGSAGAAYLDDQQNMQLLFQNGSPRGIFAAEKLAADGGLVHPPQDWKPVLAVAEAVKKSLQSGQAVSLEGR
jgi:predicted dehydrogenase